MLGIGVGIDYALLILTRYRAAGGGIEAIREAVGVAGRSVLIAGLTVVISLLGLFAMGLTYLYGVALAAIIAVLVVMAAAITLLPALLGFTSIPYGVIAAALGAGFVWYAWKVLVMPEADRVMRPAKALFAYSLLYLFAIFAAYLGDAVVARALGGI